MEAASQRHGRKIARQKASLPSSFGFKFQPVNDTRPGPAAQGFSPLLHLLDFLHQGVNDAFLGHLAQNLTVGEQRS